MKKKKTGYQQDQNRPCEKIEIMLAAIETPMPQSNFGLAAGSGEWCTADLGQSHHGDAKPYGLAGSTSKLSVAISAPKGEIFMFKTHLF